MSLERLSGDSESIKEVIAQIPDSHPHRKMLETIEGQFGNVEVPPDQKNQILNCGNKGAVYNGITFGLGSPSTHNSRELSGRRSHIYYGQVRGS
jgi:hypothetical protein